MGTFFPPPGRSPSDRLARPPRSTDRSVGRLAPVAQRGLVAVPSCRARVASIRSRGEHGTIPSDPSGRPDRPRGQANVRRSRGGGSAVHRTDRIGPSRCGGGAVRPVWASGLWHGPADRGRSTGRRRAHGGSLSCGHEGSAELSIARWNGAGLAARDRSQDGLGVVSRARSFRLRRSERARFGTAASRRAQPGRASRDGAAAARPEARRGPIAGSDPLRSGPVTNRSSSCRMWSTVK